MVGTKMPHLRFNNPKTPGPKTGLSSINKIAKGEISSITPRGMGLSGLGVHMNKGGNMSEDPFKGKKAHPPQKLAGGGFPFKAAKPNKGAKKKEGPKGPRGPNLKPSLAGPMAAAAMASPALSGPAPTQTGVPAAPVGPPPSGPLAGMRSGGVRTLSKTAKMPDKPVSKDKKDPQASFPKSKKDSGTEMKKGGMRQRG